MKPAGTSPFLLLSIAVAVVQVSCAAAPRQQREDHHDHVCVGWKQTKTCDPFGIRDIAEDILDCAALIIGKGSSSSSSGYCDCGGSRTVRFDCHHGEFTCGAICEKGNGQQECRAEDQSCNPGDNSGKDQREQQERYGDSATLSCVGWRQTGACDPNGIRESEADADCAARIVSGASGYCDCGGGSGGRTVGYGCEHAEFTCEDICQRLADADGLSYAAGGGTVEKFEFVAPPFEPACVSWRQTAGCNSAGKRESSGDKPCEEMVATGSSGFCECVGGRIVAKSRCEHRPLSCAKECARTEYTCVAWRQTGGCEWDGQREPQKDAPCDEPLPPAGASGFCECGGERRALLRGCDDTFVTDIESCAEACSRDWSMDYYAQLGLPHGAGTKEVKKAFRRLSLRYHPDRQQGKTKMDAAERADVQQRFDSLRTASETLSNVEHKVVYDSSGIEGLKEALKGGNGISKVHSMTASMTVKLEQIYSGHKLSVNIKRKVICNGCPRDSMRGRCAKCVQCADQTKTQLVQMGPFKMQQKVKVKSPLKCKEEPAKVDVEIERGMADGTKMTFKGMGEQIPGMLPGDIILIVKQAKHDTFQRRGDDLYTDVHISLKQALLGFDIKLVHLDGHEVQLRPDDGQIMTPRQVVKLKDEGMPIHNFPKQRGNLYVKYRIDMPNSLRPEVRDWLAENFPDAEGEGAIEPAPQA